MEQFVLNKGLEHEVYSDNRHQPKENNVPAMKPTSPKMFESKLKRTTVKKSKSQSSIEPVSLHCPITTPNRFNGLPQDCFENNHEPYISNSTQISIRKLQDNKSPNKK